jgi:putative transposase
MMSYQTCPQLGQSFSLVQNAFLQADGLPFADVLSAEQIQEAFEEQDALFGQEEDDVYTPPMTLWAWLSQVLHAAELRSCAAAVARVIALCVALQREPPSGDSGAYCRARAKLPEAVLRRLTYEVGDQLESRVPADWLWCSRHVKLADGSTLSPPDTKENQKEWPQPPTQAPGLGFPLLRMVVLLSLATGALCGLEIGPYQGKETGEPALLRSMMDRLHAGDVLLADCYFCSYFLIALLRARGVDPVFRQHQRRVTDFGQGKRLGPEDHLVTWERPARPDWMDEATYAQIPETLEVRELATRVTIPGFRPKQVIVVTTLSDARRYSKDEVAALFRQRWHIELDLRAVKCRMHLEDLRCKTPEMVRKEIWVHWLAYNLIRRTMAQAAVRHERTPRRMSFACALQAIAAGWDRGSVATPQQLRALAMAELKFLSKTKAGHRPNRVEPRAIKRRPKSQRHLTKPREEARAELLGTNS